MKIAATDHSWFHNSLLKAKPKTEGIGIVSFEVATLISKVIEQWKFLTQTNDYQVFFDTTGVRKLVSHEDKYLLGLIFDEVIDNFRYTARYVALLAEKCSDPRLKSLEHDFDDHLLRMKNSVKYSCNKMEKMVKKMENLVLVNQELYEEMQSLSRLEQSFADECSFAELMELEKKVEKKQEEVKQLKNTTIWNCSYDYVVGVLVRFLSTILDKIELVSGIVHVGNNRSIKTSSFYNSLSVSRQSLAVIHPYENGGVEPNQLGQFVEKERVKKVSCCPNPKPNETTLLDLFKERIDDNGVVERNKLVHFDEKVGGKKLTRWPNLKANGKASLEHFIGCVGDHSRGEVIENRSISVYSSKNQMQNAPVGTLGQASLEQAYAKVIIEIDRLMVTPILIRNDPVSRLEERLPGSLREAVMKRMRSRKSRRVWLSSSVEDWMSKLSPILDWLAPLAYDTRRKWDLEQSYAHQNIISDSREKVLLVQTLHYADNAKVDAAVSELFIGLKYMCRLQGELGGDCSEENECVRSFR